VKDLTADELANRLDGATTKVGRGFGKLLRPIVFASLLAGMVVHESNALAIVGVDGGDGNITSVTPGSTPTQAYNFGYAFGQDGRSMTGMTGDPAIDEALTNGNIDALEGLPSNPPPSSPPAPPGPPDDQSMNLDLSPDTPNDAYALGFELGESPNADAFAIGLEGADAATFAAFDDGFDAGDDGAADSCASCASCASCGSCGDGGCGGGGGCGGCG
jgi:hypothetical protein